MTTQERIDELIMQLRGEGYLTLSRRFSNYLPEPQPVGDYKIDALGKYKKNYAIGINLTIEDLENPALPEKITFLANRQIKSADNKVQLFVGVPSRYLLKIKNIISMLNPITAKKIRIVPIAESDYN